MGKEMTPSHWQRQYLISEISIGLIKSELEHIRRNAISTPDTEASFKNIAEVLDQLKGA
jgi:hypothetical protein